MPSTRDQTSIAMASAPIRKFRWSRLRFDTGCYLQYVNTSARKSWTRWVWLSDVQRKYDKFTKRARMAVTD